MKKRLILGSQSPRRKEILGYFSLPFEVIKPNFKEEDVPFEDNPEHYASTIARGKANSLRDKYPEDIILTADTIVYCEGRLFIKPQSPEEAFEILSFLSGRWHSVYTAITVCHGTEEYSATEETRVLFNDIPKDKLSLYHQHLHCDDKAGGYAIQMSGSLIVNKIDGCFYNVMGMPVNTMHDLLAKVGIDLWNYLA